ncbi:MAG TPA: putative Ig domain-containing protein [Actinoplanes sp.]|nr:putative Ig domain-containing protein [Actinoplanes sp.]
MSARPTSALLVPAYPVADRTTRRRASRTATQVGGRRCDDGFSLLEVLVSLSIVGVVMAALAPLMTTALRIGNYQDELQLATQAATNDLEHIHRMDPAGLLKGRDKQSVDASYDNPVTPEIVPYLEDMERAWDSTAAPGTGTLGTTRIRTVTESIVVNGVYYNKRKYVGRCWQSTSGGPCVKSPQTGVEFFRVVVRVSWGNWRCPANACFYAASALIANAPSDPVFNTNAAPTVTPVANQTTPLNTAITAFTLAYTGGTTPISWSATGQPPGITVRSNGQVSGTPTAAGTYTVTCRAIDGNGKIGSATFTWTVT